MILAAARADAPDVGASEWELALNRVRGHIRSANALRLFSYLARPGGARIHHGLDKHLIGPAMQGIRCAVLRAGLDPGEVLPRLRGASRTPSGPKKPASKAKPAGKGRRRASMEAAPPPAPRREAPPGLTAIESSVHAALAPTPASADEVAVEAGVSRLDARAALERLASMGLAVQVPGAGWAAAGSEARGRLLPGDVVEEDFAMLVGDAEERLGLVPDESVDVIVTSSPYYRERRYGIAGEIGWEPTPGEFVGRLVGVLRQCARTLRPHGLIFFNFDDHVGDGRMSCIDAGLMTRLHEAGLEKFREIIWVKTTHMPNGTENAPSHGYEKVFVFKKPKSAHYWDQYKARVEAKSGGMKRMGDVWTLPPASVNGSHSRGRHFAAFPPDLVRLCLDVGTSEKGYCPDCGKPWERVLERGESTWKKVGATRARSNAAAMRTGKAQDNGARDADGKTVTKRMADMRHVGWEPGCSHRTKPVKAMVMDPFVGSGTSAIVSAERGCAFIGIDLNPANVAMSVQAARTAAERRKRGAE